MPLHKFTFEREAYVILALFVLPIAAGIAVHVISLVFNLFDSVQSNR